MHIINHTGTVFGVNGGETATFDVEFVGDSRPHRFDLQFVRAGTNVVIGSIPVVLGTRSTVTITDTMNSKTVRFIILRTSVTM